VEGNRQILGSPSSARYAALNPCVNQDFEVSGQIDTISRVDGMGRRSDKESGNGPIIGQTEWAKKVIVPFATNAGVLFILYHSADSQETA
jgi:hypothetical protein